MGLLNKFSAVAALSVLILSFQNCSRVSFLDSASKLTSTDSGTPYEGKIFVTLGNLCDDGTEIRSRIIMTSPDKAKLNRDDCQDIAPVTLTSNDFQLAANSDSLIYKTQNFIYIGSGTLGITKLVANNDATNFYYGYDYDGQPSWLQIYLDTDNNPATGFYHDGIGADYMIENDNVWKYSAAVGAPQSTWAWTSVVSANKNKLSQSISWSFAMSSIGSPSVLKIMAHTSLGSQTGVITQVPK
jgi:hypothetical protein